MPDQEQRTVPELTALNETPANGDLLHIVDASDTTDDPTGTSKKVTRQNLVGGLAAQADLDALQSDFSVEHNGDGTHKTDIAETLTNKVIDGDNNTITNLGTTAVKDAAITSRKMNPDKIQVATSTTDLNSTSSTYIDYTGLTKTFTPDVASNLLVLFNVTGYASAVNSVVEYVVLLDGAIQGNDPQIVLEQAGGSAAGNVLHSGAAVLWISGVSASSHTVKVQVKILVAGTMHTTYGSLIIIPFAS